MTRWAAILVAFAVVAVLGMPPVAARSQVRTETTAPPAFVVALAKRSAASLGDPAPTSAIYVASRRAAAVEVSSGAGVNSSQPVYLVVLRGHFVAFGASRPFGAPAPRGTVASYVIDAATGQDIDFGLGSQPINAARLGRVGDLLPYLRGEKTPACGAPDLRGRASFEGATGSMLGGLTISNVGSRTCSLPALAKVTLIWRNRPLAVRHVPFPDGWLRRENPRWTTHLHLLRPKRSALVLLQWMNWCGPHPWGRGAFQPVLRLSFPAQAVPLNTRLSELMTAPFCNTPPSTLRVSPFLPPG